MALQITLQLALLNLLQTAALNHYLSYSSFAKIYKFTATQVRLHLGAAVLKGNDELD